MEDANRRPTVMLVLVGVGASSLPDPRPTIARGVEEVCIGRSALPDLESRLVQNEVPGTLSQRAGKKSGEHEAVSGAMSISIIIYWPRPALSY